MSNGKITRIPFRKSLAFRLLLITFILLSLPLLVDSFIIIQNTLQDAIQDAKGHLVEVAASREMPLTELQPAKLPTLLVLETFLELREKFPQEATPKLDQKLKELAEVGNFYGIFLLKREEDGRYIVTSASDSDYKNRDYTDFINLMDIYSPETYRQGLFSFLSYDSQTMEPYFLVGRVIISKEEKPLGILIVTLNISEKLTRLLAPDDEKYPVNFALLLPSTIVFASGDSSLKFNYFAPLSSQFRKLFVKEELAPTEVLPENPLTTRSLGYPFFEFTWKGQQQIGYIKKFPGSQISLLAYASKGAIFAEPFKSVMNIYGAYISILIVGGIIAFLLTRRFARPKFQLEGVMRGIQQGDLSLRYKPDPLGYEMNTVGEIFNFTIESLLQKQKLAEEERVARETYAQELKIGQQVQRSLLVEKIPDYPNVEIAHRYLPAKEVAGDFYDVFVRGEDASQLVLVIADASGKGVRACFYSLGVKSMLRSYADKFEDVAEAMKKTNDLFCMDTGDTGMFVTVFMCFYDQQTQMLSYSSCGHNPALLRKKSGEILELDHMSMAMGIEKDLPTNSSKVKLEKGDVVVLYTDGITEAHDTHFHLFSEERLKRFLQEEGTFSSAEIADKLLEEVQLFSAQMPQHDDITLLIMKII